MRIDGIAYGLHSALHIDSGWILSVPCSRYVVRRCSQHHVTLLTLRRIPPYRLCTILPFLYICRYPSYIHTLFAVYTVLFNVDDLRSRIYYSICFVGLLPCLLLLSSLLVVDPLGEPRCSAEYIQYILHSTPASHWRSQAQNRLYGT